MIMWNAFDSDLEKGGRFQSRKKTVNDYFDEKNGDWSNGQLVNWCHEQDTRYSSK